MMTQTENSGPWSCFLVYLEYQNGLCGAIQLFQATAALVCLVCQSSRHSFLAASHGNSTCSLAEAGVTHAPRQVQRHRSCVFPAFRSALPALPGSADAVRGEQHIQPLGKACTTTGCDLLFTSHQNTCQGHVLAVRRSGVHREVMC